MGKFFNWEDDPDLSTNPKIISFPITEEQKQEKRFRDLEDGFSYSDKGMIQKEQNLVSQTYEYDPEKVKYDRQGRMYFLINGERKYFDRLGNVYYRSVNEFGEEEDYIVLNRGEILYFKNPAHTIGITSKGLIYVYDPTVDAYVYSPDLEDDLKPHR